MQKAYKLRLQIPYSEMPGEYFSFRLKKDTKNEESHYDKPKRMILVSDIEGNFLALQRLLIKNKVIDRNHNWIFKDGHLIILGDCFDRGEYVIECLWLIYSLEERARKAGGYVHFILGNHEIMNLRGDWRYVHPKYAKPTTKKNGFIALYDGNNILWQWLLTKNIMEKIGDILIVHGGISPEINMYPYSIEEINELARSYYTRGMQQFQNPILELIFNSNKSPFWYRGYYDGSCTEQQVDETLARFKVNTIITGHTITESVQGYYNGKVININTDHSIGNSQGLLISGKRFYKLNSIGAKERIK